MTQFSDGVRVGAAWWGTYPAPSNAGEREDLGVPLFPIQVVQITNASTAAANNIVSGVSATTTAVNMTATGALVSGSIATLDYARCLQMSATTDLSYGTITVTGTDRYGQTQINRIAGPTATAVAITLSAFKTASVFAWAATASMTSAIAIGSSNTFGLPYVLTDTSYGLGEFIDGATPLSVSTWTPGLATSVTPTATTADVRGTVALATSSLPDGTKDFALQMLVQPGTATTGVQGNDYNKVLLYGQTPYAG